MRYSKQQGAERYSLLNINNVVPLVSNNGCSMPDDVDFRSKGYPFPRTESFYF